MKKFLNPVSVVIFSFVLFVYITFFNGIDLIPDKALFPLMIGGSIIGITLAWFGRKGTLRNLSMLGNFLLLIFTVIVPIIVRTFIWNTP